jgi:putative transposase
MARRPRLLAPGLLYHVIARGNQRRPTFVDERDYRAYLTRLATYRDRYAVRLYAYCLMPNHVHLLVETGLPPLSKFMQGLQQAYTVRFNRVHDTVGHVFQGRYKAIVCDSDAYLATLVRYIHLNPVRAGLVARPEDYPHSGHHYYLRGASTGLLDTAPVLRLLGGVEGYRCFVRGERSEGGEGAEGLEAAAAGEALAHQPRLYRVVDQQVLGGMAFVERVRRRGRDEVGGRLAVTPAEREPLAAVLPRLASHLGVDAGVLASRDRSHRVTEARGLAAFLLVRRLGYRLLDVARVLQRDPATLCAGIYRIGQRITRGGEVADLARRLSGSP